MRFLLLSMAIGLCGVGAQGRPQLHVLLDNSTEMPHAQIVDARVIDGLSYDLGLQLASRLGREAIFRPLPRRRVEQVLSAGEQADVLCNYLPEWLPGAVQWSQPFLPDGMLLVSAKRVTAPRSVMALADQTIGAVHGFIYPELDEALGPRFRRENAPNIRANLRKLAIGRVDHAVVGRITFEYLLRRDASYGELHPPLQLTSFKTRCALSPHSQVTLRELNAAIAAMQGDGSLQRLLARYR